MRPDKEKINTSVQKFIDNIFQAIENGNKKEDIQNAVNEMVRDFGVENEQMEKIRMNSEKEKQNDQEESVANDNDQS